MGRKKKDKGKGGQWCILSLLAFQCRTLTDSGQTLPQPPQSKTNQKPNQNKTSNQNKTLLENFEITESQPFQVGKSVLADLFFEHCNVEGGKRREHFHECGNVTHSQGRVGAACPRAMCEFE